jgi:hypothetical protein
MITRETSFLDSLMSSARGSQSASPPKAFTSAPEEGVRLLRAFSAIPQAALRQAVIELATKYADSADRGNDFQSTI